MNPDAHLSGGRFLHAMLGLLGGPRFGPPGNNADIRRGPPGPMPAPVARDAPTADRLMSKLSLTRRDGHDDNGRETASSLGLTRREGRPVGDPDDAILRLSLARGDSPAGPAPGPRRRDHDLGRVGI